MGEFQFELGQIVEHIFFNERKLKVVKRIKIESLSRLDFKYICAYTRKRRLNDPEEFTFAESKLATCRGEYHGK